MTQHGFYIVKDSFFDLANDPHLENNKGENRPFYLCFAETNEKTKLLWMIPVSSRIEKYQGIIDQKAMMHKPIDGLYICEIRGRRKEAFLIQDMFPITANYIEREYSHNGSHFLLTREKGIVAIEAKANKVLRLLKKGIRLTPTSSDVERIIAHLNS